MTYEEYEDMYAEAHRWLTLADAGEFIDQYGVDVFLRDVLNFVNNPENEYIINELINKISH